MIPARCHACGHFTGCHRIDWPARRSDWLCCDCIAWALRMIVGGAA